MEIEYQSNGSTISIGHIRFRCPHCGHFSSFPPLLVFVQSANGKYSFGEVLCPNPKCNCIVFVVLDSATEVFKTFPASRIDFDKSNIPVKILNTFQEAVTCHSEGCYVASAIMIRKTLEVIAEDKGATGPDLKNRLESLGKIILIPKELLDGLDELRLIGNDAAHVESKSFEQIGKEEIEVSISFTKEILKAVYQYEDLLKKLRSLKKKP